MQHRKFVWVGRNKTSGEILVTSALTTTHILRGNYLSFFSLSNREPEGNCEFMLEIYEHDILTMTTIVGMVDIEIKCVNNKFVGSDYFTTRALEEYFNSPGFVSIKINYKYRIQ